MNREFNHATGLVDLTEDQEKFIEWLVDPARKGSQNDCARTIGVNPSTLSKWKRDLSFRKAWDTRLAELNVQPDRIQKVIESLYENAIGSGPQSVKAQELYLRFVDRFIPKEEVVTRRGASDLSDDELADAAENVLHLRKRA